MRNGSASVPCANRIAAFAKQYVTVDSSAIFAASGAQMSQKYSLIACIEHAYRFLKQLRTGGAVDEQAVYYTTAIRVAYSDLVPSCSRLSSETINSAPIRVVLASETYKGFIQTKENRL
jgi:hypothetical protein